LLCLCCSGSDVNAASRTAGSIVTTGQMTAARFDHAAVLLPSGCVFIVGGIERNGVMQPSAELFDPATGRFSVTGTPLAQHGWGVTATLLRSGKVLVAGGSTGCDSPCYMATAELYDPATARFAFTGKMTVPRAEARAVLLRDGDVLFVGGAATSENHPALTAELYHPSTGSFTSVGATHLSDATQIVLLNDGRALVAGSSGTDVYDPTTRRFASTGAMTVPRSKFGGALLPDGRVLIAGGQAGGPWGSRVRSTQIYDPRTGKFSTGPMLIKDRFKLSKAVVALKDGRVLIAGGADQPEVYDPDSGVFVSVSGAKLDGFCFSTATLLNDGRVLLAGGYARPGSEAVNHAWLYQPWIESDWRVSKTRGNESLTHLNDEEWQIAYVFIEPRFAFCADHRKVWIGLTFAWELWSFPIADHTAAMLNYADRVMKTRLRDAVLLTAVFLTAVLLGCHYRGVNRDELVGRYEYYSGSKPQGSACFVLSSGGGYVLGDANQPLSDMSMKGASPHGTWELTSDATGQKLTIGKSSLPVSRAGAFIRVTVNDDLGMYCELPLKQ
jgi:hypothetical protein